ncbi:MAG: hypothetical protein ACFB21_12620 [Opitutales bacterium]
MIETPVAVKVMERQPTGEATAVSASVKSRESRSDPYGARKSQNAMRSRLCHAGAGRTAFRRIESLLRKRDKRLPPQGKRAMLPGCVHDIDQRFIAKKWFL